MNVDGLFVISLDTDVGRRKIMQSWYPPNLLNFYIVKRMKNPEHGCYNSHQQIMIQSKKEGLKKILILEDDAYPIYQWSHIVQITNDALKTLDQHDSRWKFLLLGYMPVRSQDSITSQSDVIEVKCAFDSHAYIANLEEFTHVPFQGIPIDAFLFCNVTTQKQHKNHSKILDTHHSSNGAGVYGTNPILFRQKASKSTIDPNHVFQDKLVEFYGNEHNMLRASMVINTLHPPILVFIFIIIIIILLIVILAKTKIRRL